MEWCHLHEDRHKEQGYQQVIAAFYNVGLLRLWFMRSCFFVRVSDEQ